MDNAGSAWNLQTDRDRAREVIDAGWDQIVPRSSIEDVDCIALSDCDLFDVEPTR